MSIQLAELPLLIIFAGWVVMLAAVGYAGLTGVLTGELHLPMRSGPPQRVTGAMARIGGVVMLGMAIVLVWVTVQELRG